MSFANLSQWTGVASFARKKTPGTGSPVSRPPSTDLGLGSSASVSSLNGAGTASVSTNDTEELGTLIIVVMKAKNLHNRRAISKQNPYCSVRVAKNSDRTKAIIRGGQAPVWDHETRFKLLADDDNRQLKLCVFDQNGSNTEIIGDAVIPLRPALRATPREGHDSWYPIHYNKRYVGEVYLEMTFYPKRRRSSRTSMTSSASASSLSSLEPRINASGSNNSLSSLAHLRHSESMPALPQHGVEPTRSPSPVSLASLPSLPSLPNLPSVPAAARGHPMRAPSPLNLPPLPETGAPIQSPSPLGISRAPSPTGRRTMRPLPQIPPGARHSEPIIRPIRPEQEAQDDISRQINDRYEASLFERLKPSASQPFL